MLTQFNYHITGTGWAKMDFITADTTLTLVASYVQDSLTDLLWVLANNFIGPRNGSIRISGESDYYIADGDIYDLVLTRTKKNLLYYQVFLSPILFEDYNVMYDRPDWDDIEGELPDLLLSGCMPFMEFTKIIFEGTKRMIEREGEKFFNDDYISPFFAENFNALERFLNA